MPGPVCFAAHHDRPDDPGGSVRHGYGGNACRLAREQRYKPWIGGLRLSLHTFDQRRHADNKQRAKVFVAHFGDVPEPLLAATRVLTRRQPQPRGELPPRAE